MLFYIINKIITISVIAYMSSYGTEFKRFLFLFVDSVAMRTEIRGETRSSLVLKDNKIYNNLE